MPGFYISNIRSDIVLENFTQASCVRRDLPNDEFTIKSNTLNKFLDDKVFAEDARYICVTDGYILNSSSLLKKHGCAHLFDLIKKMLSEGDTTFFSIFRGYFTGALYDKITGKWMFYTNHTGDQPLFYYAWHGKFIVASQFNYIIDALRKNGLNYTLNERAAYNMLTYGYMPDRETFANEVTRLYPGTYIQIVDGQTSEHTYYTTTNSAFDLTSMPKHEIIDRMDALFREAVALEFEKDRENGCRHLADLSGGLDCRMVTCVARSLGYDDIVNISFGQSGCMDQLLSQRISKRLGTSYLFMSLDDLSFLYDIDTTVRMNYGMTCYTLTTGSKRLMDLLNINEFGISHTGLIGDNVIGTCAFYEKGYPETDRSIMDSAKLEERVGYIRRHDNFEIECMYKRRYRGIMSAMLLRRYYMEASTAFANVEFLDFCMSIPSEMRKDHALYLEWISQKYPEVADIEWDKTGLKPSASEFDRLVAKVRHKSEKFFVHMLGRRKDNVLSDKKHMNPLSLWYNESDALRKYFSTYFDVHITCQVLSEKLREDMRMLFAKGTVREKAQVLTALSAITEYFG